MLLQQNTIKPLAISPAHQTQGQVQVHKNSVLQNAMTLPESKNLIPLKSVKVNKPIQITNDHINLGQNSKKTEIPSTPVSHVIKQSTNIPQLSKQTMQTTMIHFYFQTASSKMGRSTCDPKLSKVNTMIEALRTIGRLKQYAKENPIEFPKKVTMWQLIDNPSLTKKPFEQLKQPITSALVRNHDSVNDYLGSHVFVKSDYHDQDKRHDWQNVSNNVGVRLMSNKSWSLARSFRATIKPCIACNRIGFLDIVQCSSCKIVLHKNVCFEEWLKVRENKVCQCGDLVGWGLERDFQK